MTVAPKRLGIKFSLKREPRMQPADILPIFQRWIQQRAVEGMLIDVIDYKHVPAGPSIILIADEGDYAYDLGDGQIGLHYIRKRALPADLADALRLTIRLAIQAAMLLEQEAPGDIAFDFSQLKISFIDRRHYRGDPTKFAEIHDALAAILSQILGGDVALQRVNDDPRLVFALRASLTKPIGGQELLNRILSAVIS